MIYSWFNEWFWCQHGSLDIMAICLRKLFCECMVCVCVCVRECVCLVHMRKRRLNRLVSSVLPVKSCVHKSWGSASLMSA